MSSVNFSLLKEAPEMINKIRDHTTNLRQCVLQEACGDTLGINCDTIMLFICI